MSLLTAISAGQVITGASLSSTVMVIEHTSVLPLPSSTVQVTTVSPSGSTSPAIVAVPVRSLVRVVVIQLSVNVASNSVPCTVYSHTPPMAYPNAISANPVFELP